MILFLDTETTGPKGDNQPRICQLCLLFTDAALNTKSVLSSYVKPDNWHIPKSAQNYHGITTEQCDAFGLRIENLLKAYTFFAAHSDLIVAHNASFDKRVIEAELKRADLSAPSTEWFCTMRAATDILALPLKNGRAGYKWPSLREAFNHFTGKELENAHDALYDTRACREVYRGVIEHQLKTQNLELVE